MKKEFNIIFILLFAFLQTSPVFAINDNAFDLFALVETVFSQETAAKPVKQKIKQDFDDATNKFNQGNVATAYDEYLKIIDGLKNDFALLNFSKFLYKNGLFSLGDIAVSKIKNQDRLKDAIADLKLSYQTGYSLGKDEEIYLAKAFVSIYYDNSAQEAMLDLNKKTNLIEKSDYANYVMAQAFYELKQYNQALNYIKNANDIAPKNVNYNFYKAKILIANKNYTQALKLTERKDLATLNFANDFRVMRHSILATTEKNPSDKKYQSALSAYYAGNYYKTISDCKGAISLNKKNIDAINLLGRAQLKIGDVEAAEHNFNISNNTGKNNGAAIGLGDISFIRSNFVQANAIYKKAYSPNNSELTLKLILTNQLTNDDKTTAKLEKNLPKPNSALFFDNYEIATTLLNNVNIPNSNIKTITSTLQAQYLKETLVQNPFYTNAWYQATLLGLQSDKRSLDEALIQVTTLGGEFDYMYYYTLAQVEYARKNYEKTVEYLNAALSLNSRFEPAGKLLLNLKIR